MKKIIIVSMMVFCIVFLTSSIYAMPDKCDEGGMQKRSMQKGGMQQGRQSVYDKITLPSVAKKLNLTDAQKERIEEEQYSSKIEKMEVRHKQKIKELELQRELKRSEVNKKAVNRLVADISKLQAESLKQKIGSILEIREILTQEQFETLQSLESTQRTQGRRSSR